MPYGNKEGPMIDYMKLSQDTTNEIWSVILRRQYDTPGDKKRAIERQIRSALETALKLKSTVDGWEDGMQPITGRPTAQILPNPHELAQREEADRRFGQPHYGHDHEH